MSAATLSAFQRAGDDLFRCGLVVPGSGNLSVWTPSGVLITREGAALHRLTDADLCLIARNTEPPVATPSRDTPIHRAIYVTTGGRAVAHARPPHLIAFSYGKTAFEPPDLDGSHLFAHVPIVSPKRSVVDLVAQASATCPVVIVEGHGTYARGVTLEEAVHLTAMLEVSARVAWLTGKT
jgi:L-fuculose-phosphate aldolase